MKEILYAVLMLALSTSASHAATEEKDSILPNPYVTTYPFRSVVIHYTGEIGIGHGRMTKGTEVVYIKNDRMAKHIKAKVSLPDGKTKDIDSLQIIDPDYVYILDLVEKKGIKIRNSKQYGKASYESLSDEEKKAFHNRMEKRNIISLDLLSLGTKIGTDKILGRKCDVYEAGEKPTDENLPEALEGGRGSKYVKSWIWSNAKIPLKVITEGVGYKNKLVATKIEENVEIPESIFSVPAGVEVTYDKKKSEASLLQTQSSFHLLKTGKSMVIRKKVEKEVINPGKASEMAEPEKKDQKPAVKN